MLERRRPHISKSDALTKAQRFCVYQDRCQQEVRAKLLEWGLYGDDVDEVLAELIVDNFLNEERFARSFARGKFRMKAWGRLRISQELKRRAISDYCIRKALADIDSEDYRATLREILAKQAAQHAALPSYECRVRAFRYALSRGFEGAEIEIVWKDLENC